MFIGAWLVSSKNAEDVAGNLFAATSKNAKNNIEYLLEDALSLASKGAVRASAAALPKEGVNSNKLPILIETLAQNDALYSVYYGFDDGTFFQVIAARNSAIIKDKHKAPKATKWIVRSIINQAQSETGQKQIQRWSFLDENQLLIGGFEDMSPQYDPRERPWYKSALSHSESVLSAPYLFSSLNSSGVTASKQLPDGTGVFGVDLTLADLSSRITSINISDNGGIFLFGEKNVLIAHSSTLGNFQAFQNISKSSSPLIQAVLTGQKQGETGKLLYIEEAGTEFYVSHFEKTFPGTKFSIAIVAPSMDFKGFMSDLQQQLLLISGVAIILFIPFSYMFAANLSKQILKLANDTKHIQDMKFHTEKPSRSRVLEFDNLTMSFYQMSQALAHKTKALEREQEKLSRLVELGIAMAGEKDSDKLMEMVLMGAKELSNADGGTFYTIEEDQKIHFQIICNDSLNMKMGGTSGQAITIPPVNLISENDEPNLSNVVSYAVHKETSVNISDAYDTDSFDFSGTKIFDKMNGYKSQSFLTVPLKPRGGEVIGAIQIINAQDGETGNPIPFSEEIQSFVEALAAQAATALYNRQLLKAQEDLMDSLIHLIASAVDAKSPYTGAHCERVPELAIMLAQEACKASTGDLADFTFETKDQWREFEIGAWLHDCGKVTTPEYVVDKATKLETIYNRIHEVRARFEILLRDAEIEHLKSISHGIAPEVAKETFEKKKQELLDDYSFVADCNVGSEFMADEKIERLQNISKIKWMRHFNIQLGLSHEEAKRYADEPVEPCEEDLLSDKSLHIIARERDVDALYKDCNFKIDVPTDLYNQGEVYNLSVKYGTLTDEERFKIKEHVMQTIVMLNQLPLPKHLKRIPEYAGTHHETLVGNGYPSKLDAKDLSIPARIMAIADVFEALTASDRPYKLPKTLSESIKILSSFKKKSHIDPVLFDLFLTSGVYKVYAQKFLTPDQIDEVEISDYIG